MKRTLAIALLSISVPTAPFVAAQSAAQPATTAGGGGGSAAVNAAPPPALIRDPRTGRLYKQELKSIEQPVTRWQRKLVDRTIVVPQTVIENRQVPQTTYVAQTEYVLQQRLKGWWNPFAQPTYAYEYVPVTRWVPQTQMVTQQVPTVKMVPKTEQIAIDEPVQTTERVERLVVTEVTPAASSVAPSISTSPGSQLAAAPSSQTAYSYPVTTVPGFNPAMQTQPLVARIPVLSQQRILPWQPGTLLTAPASQLRSIVRGPAMPAAQSNYHTPTAVAARPGSTVWGRDLNQSGMPATVVR